MIKILKALSIAFLFLSSLSGGVDYLIIYHKNFNDPDGWMSDLKSVLESQGHSVVYFRVYDGYRASSIKNIIINFNFTYPELKYVLLIGKGKDNPIPQGESFPRYNHVVNSSYGNYIPFYYYINNKYFRNQKRDIPSDWQYVEGTDLLIGRVPASSISDIENWVSKLEKYYKSLNDYTSWKNIVRHFSQNNDNIDNGCESNLAEFLIKKENEFYYSKVEQELVVHRMTDVHISRHCDHSEAADELFRNKIEEGAGLTIVSGTGGAHDNFAGFFFPPNISSYTFSDANPNFIYGNTCSIGNTSHPEATYGTVLENLLLNPDDGIVGAFAPTVVATNVTINIVDDIIHRILFRYNIRRIGELAKAFWAVQDTLSAAYYFSRWKKFFKIMIDYHGKSMVLYGDPSMPLALYRYVNEDIIEDTEWYGSIIIERNISIENNSTLRIKPGTGVFFKNGVGLTVRSDARLMAGGNKDYPIVFSAATENPAPGSWYGIVVEDGGEIELNHAKVEYATYGVKSSYADV